MAPDLKTQRQLSTVLTEVEAVINSLPLDYVHADINSSMVLTPSHFLSLHSNHVILDLTEEIDPEFNVSRIISSSQQLLEIWKGGQKLLNQFRIIWRQAYLSNLRERSWTLLKGPCSSTDFTPKVRDVVLVKENLLEVLGKLVVFVNYFKVEIRELGLQELDLILITLLTELLASSTPSSVQMIMLLTSM